MSLPIVRDETFSSRKQIAQVIAVASGKGGVGKSTVTTNLALALRSRGKRVGILDADLYGPSIARMLPADHLPKTVNKAIEPALALGVKIVSMAHFSPDGQASAVRAPIANGIVRQFVEQVSWGELDYLLIDFPPGTGDIQLTLAQTAHLNGALMVTTPQEMALLDVRRAIDLFAKVHVPLIGIVENMSFYRHHDGEKLHPFGQGGGERLAQQYQVPLLNQIAIDPDISSYADQGLSLFHRPDGKESGSARSFLALAAQVEERLGALSESMAKKVWLAGNETLAIMWQNGMTQTWRFADLQAQCPCAGCADVKPKVDAAVTLRRFEPVGRYALRFQFGSGCSQGIYPFALLRRCGVSCVESSCES